MDLHKNNYLISFYSFVLIWRLYIISRFKKQKNTKVRIWLFKKTPLYKSPFFCLNYFVVAWDSSFWLLERRENMWNFRTLQLLFLCQNLESISFKMWSFCNCNNYLTWLKLHILMSSSTYKSISNKCSISIFSSKKFTVHTPTAGLNTKLFQFFFEVAIVVLFI